LLPPVKKLITDEMYGQIRGGDGVAASPKVSSDLPSR
jgi:hypothetical protein